MQPRWTTVPAVLLAFGLVVFFSHVPGTGVVAGPPEMISPPQRIAPQPPRPDSRAPLLLSNTQAHPPPSDTAPHVPAVLPVDSSEQSPFTSAVVPFAFLPSPDSLDAHPTLADFWDGRAEFVLDVSDTGLPMGESDAVVLPNGEIWSYLHSSDRAAGTVDQCGAPVDFPGCTVIYKSHDGGVSFQHSAPPVCQFACNQCPCDSRTDHIDQQQYPRVAWAAGMFFLTYEYRGRVMVRRSADGMTWSRAEEVPFTGVWTRPYRYCSDAQFIGDHPYVPRDYDCLAGGPPGIYVEDDQIYIFMAWGQNWGAMGCYRGRVGSPVVSFRQCGHNPLFVGAASYGPLDEKGPQTNPFFDFRTISSAEVMKVGDRYYMLYEGVRGPGPGDPGDTQFGLGLARSLTDQVDGPWEKFQGNPILVDMPGNIGVGHADLLVLEDRTLLYTSLDGKTRSRLALVWKRAERPLPPPE